MIKFIKVRRLKLNGPSMVKAIENALTGAAMDCKIDFDVTTQTWKNRPAFTVQVLPGRRVISTDSDIYHFVDAGTKPHDIRPVNAPFLAFQGGQYQAKTTPRVIGSRDGGPSGPVVFSMGVHHPGTEARDFTKVIKEKWDKELPEILQRAIDAEMQ